MFKKFSGSTTCLGTLLAIIILYFALRLPNLTLQPIFADEAIYIRWAQVMKSEPGLRFLPLSDGKTPLFMWAMMPLFKLFSDPLFAGRILSVFSGLLTLLGAFFLGWKFFSFRAGLWSALIVAITPYMVFFDRMALVDSMLAAFSIWSLNMSLLLIKYQRLDISIFLGYLLGGGLLTKTPGFFNILVLPVSLITFNWLSPDRQQRFIRLFGLWVVALITTFALYNLLRLGPGFNNLSSRNQDYVHSPLRLLEYPLDPFLPHFADIVNWFPILLTWPTLLLIIGSLAWLLMKRNTYALTIAIWALVPLIIQMMLLQTFTARYLLFSIPPLLCLGGWMVDQLLTRMPKKRWVTGLVILGILVLPLQFNLALALNPASAPLPRAERSGYLEEWTAGYGFSQIASLLAEHSRQGLVVVGTEGSFGTLPDGLWIYLDKNPNIAVIGGKATISASLRQAAIDHPTYFVVNSSRMNQELKDIEMVKSFDKAIRPDGTRDQILLFKVYPEKKNLPANR